MWYAPHAYNRRERKLTFQHLEELVALTFRDLGPGHFKALAANAQYYEVFQKWFVDRPLPPATRCQRLRLWWRWKTYPIRNRISGVYYILKYGTDYWSDY